MSNQKSIKTHIIFVLDSSGSMKDIKEETIAHFNEQIKMIKNSNRPNMDTRVSLFTFHEELNEVFFNKEINDVKELDDYNPEGMTSVIDCLQQVLDRVEPEQNTSYLVCILSDGSDNSSDSSVSNLSKRIAKLQDSGNWTFTFIGANQDLDKTVAKLKIPQGNALRYESHSLGVSTMTESQTKSLGYYFIARSYGTTSTRGFYGSLR